MKKTIIIAATALLLSTPVLAENHNVESSNSKYHSQEKGSHVFDRFDQDLDSYLNKAEWDSMKHVMTVKINSSKHAFFAKADIDGDGAISKDEMRAMKKNRSTDKQKDNKPSHADKEHKHKDGKKKHRGNKFFDKLDRDGDGKITRVEFTLPHSSKDFLSFDAFDTDGDELVSKQEFKENGKHKYKGKRKHIREHQEKQ